MGKKKRSSPAAPAKAAGQKTQPRASAPPILIFSEMRRDRVWMIATLAFAVIAISTLTKNGLWNDEWIKQYEFSGDHPDYPYSSRGGHPLHFLLFQFWAQITGTSAFAMRLPCSIFAAACVPLAYLLGGLAGGRSLARIACVMMAASSYLLFYAQDANYYAEMMFYALAAAVAFWIFLEAGNLLAAVAGLIALACLYLVHPFGAVCGGALVAGAAVGAAFSVPARTNLLRIKSERGGYAPGIIKLLAVVALLIIIFRYHLLSKLLNDGGQFLKQFRFGGSYTNTAFNFAFIHAALRDFGPNIVSKSLLTNVLAWLYVPVALLGFVAIARRKLWPALMIAFVFAATGIVIFCFKIDRFFHLRYVSYAAPLYVFLVAAGLWQLGLWIEKRFGTLRFAAALPLVVMLALLTPGYFGHLFFDGGYLRKVRRHFFEGEFPSEDRLFTYQMVWPVTPMTPLGAKPEQHITMPGLTTINQGWLNDAYFKYRLPENPKSWLLHHWNEPRTIHEPLLKWADRYMTRVVEAPSIFQNSPIQWYNKPPEKLPLPLVGAVLHRWNWPDRYVVAPRPLEINLANEQSGARYDLKKELGLAESGIGANGTQLVWRSPFLFENAGAYRFELESSSPIELKVNGNTLTEDPTTTSGLSVFRENISEMRNEIELAIQSSGPAGETLLPILRITPDFHRGFSIQPFYFHPPDPQSQTLRAEVDESGRPKLIFKRNLAVNYRLNIAEAGLYRITLAAIEDRPGPVVVDALLDGNSAGLLAFDKATDQWGKRQLKLDLSPGLHELSIGFLTELDVTKTEPNLDNDLILGAIEIAATTRQDADDRLNLGKLASGAGFKRDFGDFADGASASGWAYGGDPEMSISVDRPSPSDVIIPPEYAREIGIAVQRDQNGARLVSPRFPASAGQYVYLSLDARCDVEGKHSANILVEYYGTNGARVGSQFAGEDINARTSWRRCAYFGMAPQGAASASIIIMIYPNSRTLTPASARFDFRRMRIFDSVPSEN